MRKATTNDKIERHGRRLLAAASLALTFAAFGCTTTRYGEPTNVNPSYGPMNHGVLPGSSTGTESDTPMASSYTGISRVNVDALAILAAEQGFRGRVLGPVNPAGVQTGVPLQPFGGQFVSPALTANPQQTVNSSISSAPTPVISSGTAGGGVAIAAATASPATVATTGTTIGTTAGTTSALATTAALTTSTGAGVGVTGANGTTVAGSAVFSPVLMNSTPPPQATGTANATLPTIGATGRPLASTSSAKTARTTSTTAASMTARVTSSSTNVAMTAGMMPIRIETGTQGQVMLTNVAMSTKPASTKP